MVGRTKSTQTSHKPAAPATAARHAAARRSAVAGIHGARVASAATAANTAHVGTDVQLLTPPSVIDCDTITATNPKSAATSANLAVDVPWGPAAFIARIVPATLPPKRHTLRGRTRARLRVV